MKIPHILYSCVHKSGKCIGSPKAMYLSGVNSSRDPDQWRESFSARGIHPPNSMMHVAYSPYFHKIYKFPPIFTKFINFLPILIQFTFFCLIYVFFCFPLFWPWCIYASYFTRTGRLWLALFISSSSVAKFGVMLTLKPRMSELLLAIS